MRTTLDIDDIDDDLLLAAEELAHREHRTAGEVVVSASPRCSPALAATNRGRLVRFDRGISIAAVPGGSAKHPPSIPGPWLHPASAKKTPFAPSSSKGPPACRKGFDKRGPNGAGLRFPETLGVSP